MKWFVLGGLAIVMVAVVSMRGDAQGVYQPGPAVRFDYEGTLADPQARTGAPALTYAAGPAVRFDYEGTLANPQAQPGAPATTYVAGPAVRYDLEGTLAKP